MPDSELRSLADRGALNDPDVLQEQVERMLSDQRVAAFVENFVGQWLGLRKLGEMPPDRKPTVPITKTILKMQCVGKRFCSFATCSIRTVNYRNSSILITFLNQALARHYDLPVPPDEAFLKVDLPADSPRGGLLGRASILTATSNGVESQPVVRGVWVLNNLLGSPPNPRHLISNHLSLTPEVCPPSAN